MAHSEPREKSFRLNLHISFQKNLHTEAFAKLLMLKGISVLSKTLR